MVTSALSRPVSSDYDRAVQTRRPGVLAVFAVLATTGWGAGCARLASHDSDAGTRDSARDTTIIHPTDGAPPDASGVEVDGPVATESGVPAHDGPLHDSSATTLAGVGEPLVEPSGWGWRWPRPHGHDLEAVWGSGPKDVWVCGDRVLLRLDGRRWRRIGAPQGLCRDLWGSGPNDVYALDGTMVGADGLLLRWDGAGLSEILVAGAKPVGLAGRSASEVFLVSQSGAIFAGSGVSWMKVGAGPQDFLAVAAGQSDEAWIAAAGGVFHYQKGVTTQSFGMLGQQLTSIYTDGAQVWAVGEKGAVIRRSGGAWSALVANTTEDLTGVDGRSGSDLWLVGHGDTVRHYDGAQWTPHAVGGGDLKDVWVSPTSSDVWVVGPAGATRHYDGQTWWGTQDSLTKERLTTVYSDGKTVWMGGDGGAIWTNVSGTWKVEHKLVGPVLGLHGVGDYVAAVGENGQVAERLSSGSWAAVPKPTAATLRAVWALKTGLLVTSIDGGVYGLSAKSWLELRPPNGSALHALYADSASDFWTVGDGGTILHFTAGWKFLPSAPVALYAIHGVDAKHLFVVGDKGFVGQLDGQTVTAIGIVVDEPALRGVWADDTSTCWVVGANGTLVHAKVASPKILFDTQNPTKRHLSAVFGVPTLTTPSKDVWVVGDTGTVLHYDDRLLP